MRGNMKILLIIHCVFLSFVFIMAQNNGRVRDYGIRIGTYQTGANNAITDVQGVKVGHFTLIKNDNIRTGVTAILPFDGNIFMQKVPAAIFVPLMR